jgi:hypothetical protein
MEVHMKAYCVYIKYGSDFEGSPFLIIPDYSGDEPQDKITFDKREAEIRIKEM